MQVRFGQNRKQPVSNRASAQRRKRLFLGKSHSFGCAPKASGEVPAKLHLPDDPRPKVDPSLHVPKRLELLKEMAPRISRVAILSNPQDAISVLAGQEAEATVRHLGMIPYSIQVYNKDQFQSGFVGAINANVDALIAMPAPIFVNNEKLIADFATANHLPSAFHLQGYARAGGLMAYGPGRSHLFRRAASCVDKILKEQTPVICLSNNQLSLN